MNMVAQSIDQHPDVVALRAGYERAAETPIAQSIFGLTLLAGLYAAVSPWIIGFNATSLAVNDLIVGISVAVLAIGFGWALDRSHGMTWTLPVLGAWLIIAPWVIGDVSLLTATVWSNLIVGAVVMALGLAGPLLGMRAHQLARR